MIHVLVDSESLPDPSLTQQAVRVYLKDFRIEGNGLQLATEIAGLLNILEQKCPEALTIAMMMQTDKDNCSFINVNS